MTATVPLASDPFMRCAIDPAGEARDGDDPLDPEIMGKAAREAARRSGGVAPADNCRGGFVEQGHLALYRQDRGRIV